MRKKWKRGVLSPMAKRPECEPSPSAEGQLYLTCAFASFTHVLSIKPLGEDYLPCSDATKLFHSLTNLINASPYGITAECSC